MPHQNVDELISNFLSMPCDEQEMMLSLSRERAAAAKLRRPQLILIVSDSRPASGGNLSSAAGSR